MEVSHHLNFEMLVRQVGWEEWRRWQERRGGDQRPGVFGAVGGGSALGPGGPGSMPPPPRQELCVPELLT